MAQGHHGRKLNASASHLIDLPDKVEVCLFERSMDMGGRSYAVFAGASLMRLAHCRVKANRQAHFIDTS
jgi:hypothetical protein